MPSKRPNDSVDRILEDLTIQQAQAGLRDSVTDRQVDEILRSVGITTAPAPVSYTHLDVYKRQGWDLRSTSGIRYLFLP